MKLSKERELKLKRWKNIQANEITEVMDEMFSYIDALRNEITELKSDSLETFHATKEDLQEIEDECQMLKKERDQFKDELELKSILLVKALTSDGKKENQKLRERVAKLEGAIKPVLAQWFHPAILTMEGPRAPIGALYKALAQDDEREKN